MKDEQRRLVRIVPPASSPHGYTRASGTKVMVGDTEIPGITNIHLFAWPNGVWRADITAMCEPPEIPADALVVVTKPMSWWRRLLLRLAGVDRVEVTTMDDDAVQSWRKP